MAYRNQLYDAKINMAQSNPYLIQGSDYQMLQPSIDAKANAIKQRQDALREGYKDISNQNIAIGKLAEQMHKDEDTQRWIKDYGDALEKKVQDEIDAGNYGVAINQAVTNAGEMMKDPQVIYRIKANVEYEKLKKTLEEKANSGKISQNTRDWWLDTHPYYYNDVVSNDEVIGGDYMEANEGPVDDIDWAKEMQVAYSLINPDKGTIGRTSNYSADDVNANFGKDPATQIKDLLSKNAGKDIKINGTTQNSWEVITKDDILKNYAEIISKNPDGERQVRQAFYVKKHECDKLYDEWQTAKALDPNSEDTKLKEQIYKKASESIRNNGGLIDFDEYYARQVTDNLLAQGLAKDWRTDIRDTGISINTPSSRGSNNDKPGGGYVPPESEVKGPNVEKNKAMGKNEPNYNGKNVNIIPVDSLANDAVSDFEEVSR